MNQPAGICHEIIHPSTRHDKVHLSGVSTPPGTPFTPERGGHKLAGNDEAFQKQGNAQMWATLGGFGSGRVTAGSQNHRIDSSEYLSLSNCHFPNRLPGFTAVRDEISPIPGTKVPATAGGGDAD